MSDTGFFDSSNVVGPLPWPDDCGLPTPDTLPELLDDNARRRPDAPALVAGGVRLTYGEFADRVHQFAAALVDLGVRRDSRVAVLGSNTADWMVAVHGAMRLGARVDAFNTWVRAYDLDHLLAASEAEVLITVPSVRKADILGEFRALVPEMWSAPKGGAVQTSRFPLLRHVIVFDGQVLDTPVPDVAFSFDDLVIGDRETPSIAADGNQPAFVLYTSGSTSKPKAVPLTHRADIENAYAIGLRMGIGNDDRIWLGSPLFWSFGIANAASVALSHGACLVLQEVFAPATAAELMATERCTAAYLLPSMAEALAANVPEQMRAIDSLRTGLTIGRTDEISRIVTELGVPEICSVYGSTETYGNCCVTAHDDPLDVRLTTQGRPLPGVMLRVADLETGEILGPDTPGELQTKGRVTPGYLHDTEANAAAFTDDDWFRTGDTVTISPQGRVQFQSRHTDMIKTSGINVSPAEVEGFLCTHPSVAEVAVVGAEHPSHGEVAVAFVVPAVGKHVEGTELRAFCRSGMASYKTPWVVEIVSQLPRTGTGKMVRKDLRPTAQAAVRHALETQGASEQ